MDNNLYFLRSLIRAAEADSTVADFQAVLAEIERQGEIPGFETGHEQYCAFMDEIQRVSTGVSLPGIVLLKDGRAVAELPLTPKVTVRFVDLAPGDYTLQLTTGRELWRGELYKQDLLWFVAHPGETLPVAAATSLEETKPSRQFTLLEGELAVSVYPGFETGTMHVTCTGERL